MDFRKLLTAGNLKTFPQDEFVCHEGDTGEEMYVILSGSVDVSMNSIDGFSISIARLGPGDFFGEMSLLEGLPRCATVQAVEETKVIVVNKNNFEEVIHQEPQLAYRIMKGLSGRLRKQNEKIRKHKVGAEKSPEKNENFLSEAYISSLTGILPLPEGHQQYSVTAPSNYEEFLFQKKVVCPVCGQAFNADIVRSTKLRLKGIDPDFRQRFIDFEPLWYLIWVCPHCYYANFNYQFTQISPERKKHLQDICMGLKEKLFFAYTDPRDIDQVFIAYYLALNCITNIRPDPEQLGRVWLRLSWLYQDVGDMKMIKLATSKALEFFEKSRSSRSSLLNSSEQGQRLNMLLGELKLKLGETGQALTNFRKAVVMRGNRSLNRQANDRIMEIKRIEEVTAN